MSPAQITWDEPAPNAVPSAGVAQIKWDEPAKAPTSNETSIGGASLAKFAQGATAGWSSALWGIDNAVGHLPASIAVRIAPRLLGHMGITAEDQKPIIQQYRDYRDGLDAYNKQAGKEHPVLSPIMEGVGAASTMLIPGAGGVNAAKTTAGIVIQSARQGAAYGVAAGLGGSSADLTKGETGQAIKDEIVGGVVGGTIGAVAPLATKGTGAVLGSAAGKLLDLGRSRLFKAAVGQNKRAFTQMNGRGLLDKAGEYLQDLGIGVGDSTESIATKLTARKEAIGTSLGDTVSALDKSAGGVASVSPSEVAKRIVDEVATPLKKLAAARGEYKQVMNEALAIIRGPSGKIRKNITFDEAVAQRQAAQSQVNYDKQQGKSIAAEAREKIAKIWNEQIDKSAEPLLKQSGKAGDAYRELRHEYALATELEKHVQSRVAGNQAINKLKPSDIGFMGIAGVMGEAGGMSHPGSISLALAAAVANHVSKIYGNAAAGRAAINMAKMAAVSSKAAEKILPPTLFGSIAPALTENTE